MRLLSLALLLLSACSSRASYVRGPDGEDWLSVRCSRRNELKCLQRAGKLCPDGYESSNAVHAAGHMLIKCKGGSPRDRARYGREPDERAPEPSRQAEAAMAPAPQPVQPVIQPAPIAPPPVELTPEEQEARRKKEAEFEEWKKTQPSGSVAK